MKIKKIRYEKIQYDELSITDIYIVHNGKGYVGINVYKPRFKERKRKWGDRLKTRRQKKK